ncbi:MAG: DUF3016 domain-containing protein [Opitutaceae bacterium]
MKTNRLFLIAILAAAPMATFAREQPARNPRLEVSFHEPKNFTDIGDTYMASDSARESDLAEIRSYLSDQSRYYVPEGHRLEITFTDIDRAGDFEPWRGARFGDVRIVKEIYSPRMVLAFRMVDASGNVVKEGRRELRDLAFMQKINLGSRSEPLHHDKALLNDWLRSEFPRVRKDGST